MAVRVSAESGFEPGYMLKGQAEQAAGERTAGGYYINAAQAGHPEPAVTARHPDPTADCQTQM